MSLLKEVCNRLIDEKIDFEACFRDDGSVCIGHPYMIDEEELYDEYDDGIRTRCIAVENGHIRTDGEVVNYGVICTLDEAIDYLKKDEAT